MFTLRTHLLWLTIGLLAVMPVSAAVVEFSDLATWQAALTARTDVDFSSLSSAATSYTVGSNPDLAVFERLPGGWINVYNAFGDSCNGNCIVASDLGGRAGLSSAFALNTITAVGLNLWTLGHGPQSVTVNIYDVGGSTPSFTNTITTTDGYSAQARFYGITSDSPIGRIEFVPANAAPNGTYLAIDNFSWGQAAGGSPEPPPPSGDVPESATFAYIALGMAALYLSKRRLCV